MKLRFYSNIIHKLTKIKEILMSWINTRDEIDILISNKYSQIRQLEEEIQELRNQKSKEEHIDELIKQIHLKQKEV